MLAVGTNRFNFVYSNHSVPATTPGLSIIPGASNAEGSWTEIASAANLSQDIYEILIWVHSGGVTGQSKQHLLDIGIDPAGGTSYIEQIANIVCGDTSIVVAGSVTVCGFFFLLPYYIKSGSAVAIRIQGSNATAGTVRIVASFRGQPSRPENVKVGQHVETIGTITNSLGVSFTPGNTGAEGSWVSLGTTTRDLWWWQLGVQCDNGTITALAYNFDLAYGDGSNKVMIIENFTVYCSAGETMGGMLVFDGFCEVPAGSELFIRGSCSSTAVTGWNAVAVGVGG